MSVNEKLTAIADAIREYGNLDSSLNLDQMAAAISNVHERAYSDGSADGFSKGEEAGFAYGKVEGQKAERDAFWDMFQQNGARTNYQTAFFRFDEEFFTPKYDIAPDNATNMFFESYITDLKKLLETAGVKLDFSKARYLTSCFQKSTVTHLPVINCTNAFTTAIANLFLQAMALVYVEKMIVTETTKFSSSFQLTLSLAEIRFEGTIGEDVNFQWSPLSVESMKSIISCLKNFKGTDSAFTKKVTFTDNCWAALEANSSAPDGTTWREYVGSTLGWNT